MIEVMGTDEAKKIAVESFDFESMIESMIFISKEPLSIEKMHEAMQNADISITLNDIKQIVNNLLIKWQEEQRVVARGLNLRQIGEGYVFSTDIKNAEVLRKLVQEKPIQLSKAQVEVLSIVAYRQPLTRVEVDDIRGVDSSFAIKKLLQLKLLKILGKSEGLGRPLLYGTSKYFLEFFSLTSLNDLPTLKQYEALSEGQKEDVDLKAEQKISLKDLFEQRKNRPMFSDDLTKLSDEAVKSLDDALLNIDAIKKSLEPDSSNE